MFRNRLVEALTDDYGTTVPIGTRFRVPAHIGVTVFEYVGEAYFEYANPTGDDDGSFDILMSDTDENVGNLEEFVATANPHYGYPTLSDAGIDGIRFEYINSGTALQLTPDEEGVYVFRFWGEDD